MKPNLRLLITATATALALLLAPSQSSAQVAPNLGAAAPYAALGANPTPVPGTVTCTGPGTINGNVGTTFPTIANTGSPPCTITGSVDTSIPLGGQVVTDFNAAKSDIDTLNPGCTGTIPTDPTSSQTLAPGVYCSTAGTTLTDVTLTLSGGASDVWIFRVGTDGTGALALTDVNVVMAGGAQACNVYWKTAQAATLTDSNFVGTVLSGTAITMTRGTWTGRALASTDVTLTNPSPLTGCAAASSPNTITVIKDFIPNSGVPVSMSLSCTSGTVAVTPLNAAEGAPAVFTVNGASVGTTCTATEVVPFGYTANQLACVGVALGGSCTVTNTLSDGTGIPTLSQWMMMMLVALFALAGVAVIRQHL